MKDLLSEKIILNKDYLLRQDSDRVLLTYANPNDFDDALRVFMHPIHALLFSFFKGEKELDNSLVEIAEYFSISKDDSLNLIKPFIENENKLNIEYDGNYFTFPKELLVRNKTNEIRDDISTDSFMIDAPYDFKRLRLSIPTEILFIIGTKCVTDCIYCYADRKTKHEELSLERIFSIIEEAKKIGIRNFDLSGGEVFLHKNWKEIIVKLIDNGYMPYLSTKVPLSKKNIDFLHEIGIKELQVSLDTLDPELLRSTLGVSEEYGRKMINSLKYIDEKGIKTIFQMTLTKYTCTVKNVREVLNFISDFKYIDKCTVQNTGYSHFISNERYHEIKPTKEQTLKVSEYVRNSKFHFKTSFADQSNKICEIGNFENFRKRSLCSGNIESFILLPDGKATICEEIYWNNDFIIGDLTKSTIMEVWNSKRALELWNIDREKLSDDNPCKTCADFISCRQGLGVCWREVIAVYGKENYFFPDYRCPKAPEPINNVFSDN